uniref:Probable glucan endo-1,3-beta-glucosidase eglC n=1 Tax=Colletotrichum fructicola (strain Nara gc5) TaxID=1213859 RepID=L2GBE6_COLFN
MRTSSLAAVLYAATASAFQGFNYGSTFTDGSAKTQADFEAEFKAAASLEGTNGAFTSARLYTMVQGGSTNDPIAAIPAAISTKTSLLLGLWASAGDAAFANELEALKKTVSQYGSQLNGLVAGISIGSEDLYRHSPTGIANGEYAGAEPNTLVGYFDQVREILKGSPLSSAPLGHVDTWTAWVNGSNKAVIDACDWIGMDAYPYFEDTKPNAISDSKQRWAEALSATQGAVGGKPVWIAETGWPVSGKTVGSAVPSLENAKTFWDEVGCPMFGKTNVWWYTFQDSSPTTPNPSFGVIGSTLTNKPLYDLSCDNTTSSSSTAAGTPTATATATGTDSGCSDYGGATTLSTALLDPFQELPQLLDPHLPTWLPLLATTYLAHLNIRNRNRPKQLSTRSQLLEPLNVAIAKLLYTFTKIRGEKVVVRFLNAETRYIEPLLSALESAERSRLRQASRPSLSPLSPQSNTQQWFWEERYLVLLWLSHLLLAPFDLSTISSAAADEQITLPSIPNFTWPSDLPGITVRILPVAVKYLASPGKERDGARALLVRIAMRRDMQSQGVLTALVNWALASLNPSPDTPPQPPYFYIGVLSFLAGVIRSVTVLLLRKSPPDPDSTELIETSIGYFLECLADNDTPVRLAASKALSIVTLRLDPEMASQVVDAVLDSLNRNVLWTKEPGNSNGLKTRDLAAVDPLEWHGLMLTLSHLLYRRSPPASQLPDIVHGLLLGLSFEKRSTSGGSVGTNVRDAACFGIWALARRYTTAELLEVPTAAVVAARPHSRDASILQVLATELVVTASLDSAGNIRRGASAALQELIGRHPDTVEKGIWVVQTVDYHAVALRSRAIHEVALNATRLSPQYGAALLDGLLGWRGIGDADAASRRVAGASFGTLTLELSQKNSPDAAAQFTASIDRILARLRALQARQVDERHGLLLCLASVLDKFPDLLAAKPDGIVTDLTQRIIQNLETILGDFQKTTYRRPELVAEASSRLITSSLPILQAATLSSNAQLPLQPGYTVVSTANTQSLLNVMATIDALPSIPSSITSLISTFGPVIAAGLSRPEKEAVSASSEAALIHLLFSPPDSRRTMIQEWASTVRHRPTSRTANDTGVLSALTMTYPITSTFRSQEADVVCDTVLARWAGDNDIDTRVAILQSLSQSVLLRDRAPVFLDLLAEGLNDYTTNARGDVGSHVRLEALRATKSLWKLAFAPETTEVEWLPEAVSKLFLRILRLAAEKLDRVRTEAHAVLALTLDPSFAPTFTQQTFSSREYFHTLLTLRTSSSSNLLHPRLARPDEEAWMSELLSGYVTSADTGNEDLVIASRAALASFCAASPVALSSVCGALVANLKTRQGLAAADRVVVPTLEIVAFLCHVGLFQKCVGVLVGLRSLCLQVQRAGYKTGNVRKLEACIKVYGVRSQVVDELWKLFGEEGDGGGRAEQLKSVDWSKAEKGSIKRVVERLGLAQAA